MIAKILVLKTGWDAKSIDHNGGDKTEDHQMDDMFKEEQHILLPSETDNRDKERNEKTVRKVMANISSLADRWGEEIVSIWTIQTLGKVSTIEKKYKRTVKSCGENANLLVENNDKTQWLIINQPIVVKQPW